MKYADAGVNIAVADDAKQRIRHLASRTFTPAVLGGIGGFGALFALDGRKWKEPVLVSSADGVGTKLKIAMAMGVHSTVGGDLVNHCVNDILVQGAEPLFFLDYLAMGKLEPNVIEQVVEGMSRACRKAGCALIGGETAEMPGFYPPGEYDLAGFIVGVVEREKIITGKDVQIGDIILGLPSNGLHTNGYSLARKLLFEVAHYSPETYVNEIKNKVGNELMRTHRSYWSVLKKLIDGQCVAALAHITGGGITENLPRVLPRGTAAVIELGSWPVLPIFEHLQQLGHVEQDEMLRTFNMGLGMLLVVPAAKFKKAQNVLERVGEKAYTIGRIVKGERKVTYS
jgi:phosphoribosylformylglycinamidine cyclo-ligase